MGFGKLVVLFLIYRIKTTYEEINNQRIYTKINKYSWR